MYKNTKKIKYGYLIFSWFFMLFSSTYAQTNSNITEINPIISDITEYIPPLNALIDSAIFNSNSIKAKVNNVSIAQTSLITTKKIWLKNLSLEGYYNYGTSDYYTVNAAVINNSQQVSNRYILGASLRIPIYEFFDRKNYIRTKKFEYEKIYFESETEKDYIRKQIILSYNDLILKQKIFKITNESYLDAKMQSEMAELQFSKGEIPLSEYARIKDIKAKSQIQLETSKIEFLNAYMIMQEFTGVKFKNLKFIE